jgi:mRNA interferase MazF
MHWRRGSKPPGWFPRRGEVCLFSLDKERPALIVSNDALNKFSLDVCVVPISKAEHRQFSLRPKLRAGQAGLVYDSWIKCDQVTTVAKASAVFPPLGVVDTQSLRRIEEAVLLALGLR